MPYSVDRWAKNQLDFGRFPVLVPDNTINKAVASLKLIGKGVPNYGEHVNENFIWLLENFAGNNEPANPLTGQIWFETIQDRPGLGKLRVWDGLNWRQLTTMGYDNVFPTNPVPGDIFFNTQERRLYYFEGPTWQLLGGATTNGQAPLDGKPGELWWNTTNKKLYAYHNDSEKWSLVGPGPVVQNTQPLFPTSGDFWFNTENNKLSVFDGSSYTELANLRLVDNLPNDGKEGDLAWQRSNQSLYVWSATQNDWVLVGPDSHVRVDDTCVLSGSAMPQLGYFLFNTSDEKIYYWNGSQYQLPVSVSTTITPPTNVPNGSFWFDQNRTVLNLRFDSQWIEFAPPVVSDTPPSSPSAGQIWYDTGTGYAFWWDGSDFAYLSDDSSFGDTFTRNEKIETSSTTYNVRVSRVNGNIITLYSDTDIPLPLPSPYDTAFPNGIVGGLNVADGFKINDDAISDFVVNEVQNQIENFSNNALSLIPFPEIFTFDKKIQAVSVASTLGGKVSIAAGQKVALGSGDATLSTGNYKLYETPTWVSQELDASSTYYLRAQIINGNFALYVQKGTDSDGTPLSLKGTVGASSGGGFDSTKLDVLLAKITTQVVGSPPIVLTLANSNDLKAIAEQSISVTPSSTNWVELTPNRLILNWGRSPKIGEVFLQGFKGDSTVFTTASSDLLQRVAVRPKEVNRYNILPEYIYDDNNDNDGRILIKILGVV